ncbi:acetate kinase [Periweissella cryptocerci]|uniref:Acetate kinase n=1 Tax=Periweissella cryptocerci TaxID=2506420 RepID=A0A4P6YRQ9_9LACO|nr:acetate kinase [Periweissella cryptocerci]QBO35348.1 acetate kinase [Periweissella cryptocerci]
MKKIIAVNAGSSSLKIQLVAMPAEEVICKGQVERIGLTDSIFTLKYGDGQKVEKVLDIEDHHAAIDLLLQALLEYKIIADYAEIKGIGHRVVHGGDFFDQSVVIDDEVLHKIEALIDLAPLHNPSAAMGIRAMHKLLPDVPSVAVFDTAFYQTLPEVNYRYSLPYDFYDKYKARKYGAHGTSHNYVSHRAAAVIDKPYADLKIITLHLGAGCSITATKDGQAFDTSMGFTPLAGLTMATRAGDIDVSLVSYLEKQMGKTTDEMIEILNKESGLLGISGISSDSREIEDAMATNPRAQLAMDIFVDRIVGFVGSYVAKMGGVDALVFTAGVGENSAILRQMIIDRLAFMNIHLDAQANSQRGKELVLSTPDSAVKVLLIPTNEELMIVRDVYRLTTKNG